MTTTLAEALALRSDCQKQLASLANRLESNALIQEGSTPAENPEELLQQYHHTSSQLQKLIIAINQANQQITTPDGLPLAVSLAKRESLRQQHTLLTNLAKAATPTISRYSNSELRNIPTLDVPSLRKQADELAKQYRKLDSTIQQLNWSTHITVE